MDRKEEPASRDCSADRVELESLDLEFGDTTGSATRLLLLQRRALLGELAAGVVHDMNNLLFPIIANAGLLLVDGDSFPEESRSMIEGISASGEKAAKVLSRLLEFSHLKTSEAQRVSLRASLSNTMELLAFRFRRSKVDFLYSFEDGIEEVSINANPSQIQQLFMILAINAIEAMPRGGTLSVEVRVPPADSDFVELAFVDSGIGIPEELKPKIFEPFLSTKSEGQGSGLSLFLAHHIVGLHDGSLTFEDRLGGGTVFTIRLPVK